MPTRSWSPLATRDRRLLLQEAFEPAEALQIIEDPSVHVGRYTLPNISPGLWWHILSSHGDRVRTLTKGMTIGSPKDVETAATVPGRHRDLQRLRLDRAVRRLLRDSVSDLASGTQAPESQGPPLPREHPS